MKSVVIVACVLCVSVFTACDKDKHQKSEYPYVYLNHCINKEFGNDQLQLCFDELVSDSRCPINAFCIQEGAAVGKFTFRKGSQTHRLTLTTNTLNMPFPKDTTVDGYKFEFVNLHPRRRINENPPSPNKIYAEVRITKP